MIRNFLLAVTLLCGAHFAPGQQAEPAKEAPREQYPFFTDAENRLILDYYRPGSGNVPPVAAKREAPKPLARGGTLPEALEKSVEAFPKELDRRLRTVPTGYRRILHGHLALLVQDTTRLIVDTLDVSRR